MKTQISRLTFKPFRRFSSVYQQQGRMLSDADWNEAADIDKHRSVATVGDCVGSGAPRQRGLDIDEEARIQPGIVYIDGWYGRHADLAEDGETPTPLSPAEQSDYPNSPPWTPANKVLYVDLWECSVSALEDETLLDPALHGADTCTRTRTMVQVKWADAAVDPMNPAENPSIGDAGLWMRLRKVYQSGDPCDPCSREIDVDERIGNYLFRMEVHDLYEQEGDRHLVLKWSRENGAEQFHVGDEPPGFGGGDWIWEFFDAATEKLAGQHFPLSFRIRRGVLQDSLDPPDGDDAPKTLVRRWDGYAVINLDNGTVVEGRDRGVLLDESRASEQHGWYTFEDGAWRVNLELLECRLQLDGARFLAGDYWLAVVREAEHRPGTDVLGSEAGPVPPQGIEHHYLVLGRTGSDGMRLPRSPAEERRLHFPPLTSLQASDIGFIDRCGKLFQGAEDVQQALDALCDIGADDIAYTPACDRPLLPDLAGEEPVTVAKALNALLCQFDAHHLPLHKEDPDLCLELAATDVLSVQDALKALCRVNNGRCAVPVAPGHLAGLLEAFQADTERRELVLCLLPGEHPLAELEVTGKDLLVIRGSGNQASRIELKNGNNLVAAKEIRLENIELRIDPPEGSLRLKANDLTVQGCRFYRSGWRRARSSMIQIAADGLRPRTSWRENYVQSSWTRWVYPGSADEIFPNEVVGAKLNARFRQLQQNPELIDDSPRYARFLKETATGLKALELSKRRLWSNNARGVMENHQLLDRHALIRSRTRLGTMNVADHSAGLFLREAVPSSTTAAVTTGAVSPSTGVHATLAVDTMSVARVHSPEAFLDEVTVESGKEPDIGKFDNFLSVLVEFGYSPALEFVDAGIEGVLVNNRINGFLVLRNGVKEPYDLAAGLPVERLKNASLVASGRLIIQSCFLSKVINYVEDSLQSQDGQEVRCFQSLQVLDNTLYEDGNSLLAPQLDSRGNHFNYFPHPENFELGWLWGGQAIIANNMAAAGMAATLRLYADTSIAAPNLLTIAPVR